MIIFSLVTISGLNCYYRLILDWLVVISHLFRSFMLFYWAFDINACFLHLVMFFAVFQGEKIELTVVIHLF